MIESSFATQYPQYELLPNDEMDDMHLDKFLVLLSGIMPETPLGQIVQIRSETDPEVIKHFSAGQKKIRDEWLIKRRKERYSAMNNDEKLKQIEQIQKMFADAFS